ncbi:endonuclease domain-containing protein [Pseudoxanthomonas sp.]|jgi:very-short-patch-repair endonuclease|uniref:endonuclease domain-containing protein n=1 Tax=Pseudoxanthomonas sp. TaxID=1871049 RepID=UPI002E0E31FF|nr:endonuclease domain-containing protein [Pseudoxanthomonas sp.]
MSKPRLPTHTLDHAKQLRRRMTDAERRLWQYLRAGRLEGLKFRRQHPVPPYIVDFCCVEARLVVELDGSQHSPAADAARTRYLQSQGWRVVRFWDNDVLREVEAVVTAIWDFASRPALSPTPLPPGEGL